jgi:hypothetical protein
MRIIENIRPDRQTVMFSATFPRQMEALARRILTKPIEIQVFTTLAVIWSVCTIFALTLTSDKGKFWCVSLYQRVCLQSIDLYNEAVQGSSQSCVCSNISLQRNSGASLQLEIGFHISYFC